VTKKTGNTSAENSYGRADFPLSSLPWLLWLLHDNLTKRYAEEKPKRFKSNNTHDAFAGYDPGHDASASQDASASYDPVPMLTMLPLVMILVKALPPVTTLGMMLLHVMALVGLE
jgi:hypothetical protein